MRTAATLLFGCLMAAALPVRAQEKKDSPDPAIYRVEFKIRDGSDAAAKTGRRYTMLVDTSGKGVFKVGDKIPYATGSFQPGVGASVATQYSFLDTGVNIDCRLRELSGKITLTADIDISTIVHYDKTAAVNPPTPSVAQIRIAGVSSLVEPGKPAMVASIDDPVTMRKFDVEATVTKVN